MQWRRYLGALKKYKKLHREYQELSRKHEVLSRFYENILESVEDVVFVLDPHGIVEWINKSGEHRTGYTKEEIIGKHMYDLVHPKDRERVQALYEQVLRGEHTSPTEIRFLRKSGEYIWRTKSLSSIRNKQYCYWHCRDS